MSENEIRKAIGFLNLVLANDSNKLWYDDRRKIQSAIRVLEGLL